MGSLEVHDIGTYSLIVTYAVQYPRSPIGLVNHEMGPNLQPPLTSANQASANNSVTTGVSHKPGFPTNSLAPGGTAGGGIMPGLCASREANLKDFNVQTQRLLDGVGQLPSNWYLGGSIGRHAPAQNSAAQFENR